VSAPAIDPLWVAFWAFGFGCAVVAFAVGCWVGRGIGRVEARGEPAARLVDAGRAHRRGDAGRPHKAGYRLNGVVRRPPSPPAGRSQHDAA
jgi:hypothetical protein